MQSAKMPTIRDVAREAEVSVATVSRVMNNTAPVNDETRERIENTIKRLNYSPSPAAQSMRHKHSNDFVRLPDSPVRIDEALSDVRLVWLRENESKRLAALQGQMDSRDVILIGNTAVEGYSCVLIDERSGMEELICRLLDNDAERFGYVGQFSEYLNGIKFLSFINQLSQANKKLDAKLMYSGGDRMKYGIEAAKAFLKKDIQPPDTVVFESEAAAFGFAQFCVKELPFFSSKIRIAAFGCGEYAPYSALPIMLCSPEKESLQKAIFELSYQRFQDPYSPNLIITVNTEIRQY